MRSGIFIVFEGIDGSGKSTQARMLAEKLALEKIPCTSLSEPSKGSCGRRIRELLAKGEPMPVAEQVELFLKDREEDAAVNILPALSAGHIVIMDRYWLSNAAYQGAMGMEPKLILSKNKGRDLPKPDRTYLIDTDIDSAMKRIAERSGNARELFEKREFLAKVRDIFLEEGREEGCLFLDGSLPPEDIHNAVLKDTKALVKASAKN